MPAIVRSAAGALAFALVLAAADSDAERVQGLVLELSTSLQDSSAARFLDQVDRKRCAEYAALENNIVALVAQNEIASSVGVIEQTRDGEAFVLKLDWILQMKPANGAGPARERREVVTCRVERSGKRWKVTSLQPVAFFRPS